MNHPTVLGSPGAHRRTWINALFAPAKHSLAGAVDAARAGAWAPTVAQA